MVDDILPAVNPIVNLSIQQSASPSIYKFAKIIPLLKKDDPILPNAGINEMRSQDRTMHHTDNDEMRSQDQLNSFNNS